MEPVPARRSEGSVHPRRILFLLSALVLAVVTLWPAEAVAQRRVIRRPSRVVVGVGVGYGYPIYASPYLYDPFWWGFYDYQFRGYPPYPPYRYGYYDASADLRLQVTPRTAEVYVDGYLTGTVDQFDGVFQRLHTPLGEHEITIYAPGYRSITQRMLFRPLESYKIRETMQPLGAGEPPETRPAPSERPASQPPVPRRGAPAERPDDRNRGQAQVERGDDQYGAIAVRVQPSDAEVWIDGERWEGSSGERVLVQLSEGSHRVEVRKSGYRTYGSTVRIRSGETVTLNVSLTSGE